jgi:hypothetical protein
MISIRTEVKKVVSELTKYQRLFTAHDVTRILRHQLDGERINHKDVKVEVHSIFTSDNMGIYDRSPLNVGTAVSPFVYHLSHQDPSTDYNMSWVDSFLNLQQALSISIDPITGAPASTPTPTAKPLTVVNSQAVANRVANSKDGFKSLKTTSEGRLNIPVNMLDGFGDKAFVSLSKACSAGQNIDALSITAKPPATSVVIKTYDTSNGRLRISRRGCLDKVGLGNSYAVKDLKPQLGHNVILVVPE